MDTDMNEASASGGENPFGLSNDEWTFYQFVRASPKVTNYNSKEEENMTC
jgi:hypothetical protein